MCIATVKPIGAIALLVPLVFSVFPLQAAVFHLQPQQPYAENFSNRDRVMKDDLLADKFPSPRRVLREG